MIEIQEKEVMSFQCEVTEGEREMIRTRMKRYAADSISDFAKTMLLEGHALCPERHAIRAQSEKIEEAVQSIQQVLSQVKVEDSIGRREIYELECALSEIWRIEKQNLTKLRAI